MIAPSNLLDRNPIDLILYPNISYEIYRYITGNLLTNTSKIKHCVRLVYLDQYIHMHYGEHVSTSYRINTMQNTKLTRYRYIHAYLHAHRRRNQQYDNKSTFIESHKWKTVKMYDNGISTE